MKTYIALLRGINVSGQKKILMEDLRSLLSKLGFKDLKTYIQSGNIIFKYKKTAPEKLAALIENAILDHYKFKVPVVIRTVDELVAALDKNPFTKEPDINLKGIYIAFLDNAPDDKDIAQITQLQYLPDRYHIDGNHVHIHYSLGAGDTKLTNNFFEKKLKRNATSRNLNTVNELIRLGAME